jgi:cell wall assembly regulator SMI1
MANLKDDLQDVISRLLVEIEARVKRTGESYAAPNPLPPATAEEIATYEDYLKVRLPNSYRAFLELHNGYDHLAYPGDMLSTHAIMPGGAWHDDIQEWKTTSTQYGMGEVLDAVPIANLDSAVNWAYVDPNRSTSEGECAVVRWLNGDMDDFDDVVAFLEECILQCRMDLSPTDGE